MRAFIFSFLVIAFCLNTSSCKRSELNTDTSIAQDNNTVQSLWDDASTMVNAVSSSEILQSQSNWNNCASIHIDTLGNPFPLAFTIDFGISNCLGADGRYRRGSLIYEISNPYQDIGTIVSVKPDDYFVDDYKVEGTRTSTNNGVNGAGFLSFSIDIEDAVITTPENETISWSSSRVRTWMEGSETGFFTIDSINTGILGWNGVKDDVYEITGSCKGTSRDGRSFTAVITSALRAQLDCRWITKGVLELQPDELRTRVFDYGNGECDADAIVTIGNKDYDITLSR